MLALAWLLTLAQAPPEQSFVEPGTGAVSGRVVGADRRPLAGVQVQVGSFVGFCEWPDLGRSSATDHEGRFHVAALDCSRHYRACAHLDDGETRVSHRTFLPERDRTLELGDLRVERFGRWLSGVVLDRSGSPIAGAEVLAADLMSIARATTDGSGRFAIGGLPPTSFVQLRAFTAREVTAATECVNGNAGPPAPVVLRLVDSSRIAGRAVTESGRPLAGASLLLRWGTAASPLVDAWAISDAQGRFEFERVPDVPCSLAAHSAGRFASEFAVRAGDECIEVRLAPAAVLEGRAFEQSSERPLALERVLVVGDEPANVTASFESDADGRFRIQLAGSIRHRFDDLVALPELLIQASGFSAAHVLPRPLASGQVPQPLVLGYARSNSLSVIVCDELGQECAAARIRVFASAKPLQGRLIEDARTDAGGSRRFANLPLGPLSLVIDGEGFAQRSLMGLVLADGCERELRLELDRGCVLEGRIASAANRSAPRAAAPPAGWVAVRSGARFEAATAEIAPDGTYRFDPLPPGNYVIELEVGRLAEFEAWDRSTNRLVDGPSLLPTVALCAGQPRTIDLRLVDQ